MILAGSFLSKSHQTAKLDNEIGRVNKPLETASAQRDCTTRAFQNRYLSGVQVQVAGVVFLHTRPRPPS